MSNYDASPMMADVPVAIEEVESLLQAEGKPVLRDGRKLVHLLRRMHITINAYRQQIRSLNQDIQIIRGQSERAGMATTLNPRDAVRFLSPDQLGELVEGHLREKLGVAERTIAEAKRARTNANAELSRVRFAAASIMEDASVPADVRERFATVMRTLPTDETAPAPGARHAAAESGAGPGGAEDLGDLFS